MKKFLSICLLLVASLSGILFGKSDESAVKKAVLRSTLNQSGTHPFHLEAVIAPTRPGDDSAGMTGTVEYWWKSPTQWRREVTCPSFHQIAVMKDGAESQKNEGDYFPEWLRRVTIALVEPIPNLADVLARVTDADTKGLAGSTYYQWIEMSGDGKVEKGMGGTVAITGSTGLLFYGGGLGWGALYKDYKEFHGRMVGRTVSSGTPEVTARVGVLEDLSETASLFDPIGPAEPGKLLSTVVLPEMEARKNLLPGQEAAWPAIKDGPLTGAVTTAIAVDRAGRVREVGSIVSDNPAINDAARFYFQSLKFKPIESGGVPVQAVTRMTVKFDAVRPVGTETFDTAKQYFDRARIMNFPAYSAHSPYVLRATFHVRTASGTVEEGQYTDTWASATNWRREVVIGHSRLIEANQGEARSQLRDGPDVGILEFVKRVLEPIPRTDEFYEADWKIKREPAESVPAIRILAGYEAPDGTLDPEQARGYWIDAVSGRLVKTFFKGLEARRSDFVEFEGAQVARKLVVYSKQLVALEIRVQEISAVPTPDAKLFRIPKHESKVKFTDQLR